MSIFALITALMLCGIDATSKVHELLSVQVRFYWKFVFLNFRTTASFNQKVQLLLTSNEVTCFT